MSAGERTGVFVIGGGPAGAALAIRLSQLGHRVTLAERSRSARCRFGESLAPAVLAQVGLLGAADAVARAAIRPCRRTVVRWQNGDEDAPDLPGPPGLLVDRRRFDAILLALAREHGVRVLQPASVRRCWRDAQGWSLEIESGDGRFSFAADFVAIATGRSGSSRRARDVIGCRTMALYACWQGIGLPSEPQIEAGHESWYWGMPLPDGRFSTMAFVDFEWLRQHRAEPLEGTFKRLIAGTRLLAGCGGAALASPVRAADATAYLDSAPVEPGRIKVGEAALALDPLSSSGVQRSIQTAVAAAIVLNTLSRRDHDGIATRFYRNSLATAAARHQRWAAGFYSKAGADRDSRFWRDRAACAEPELDPSPVGPPPDPERRVALAAAAELVATPCLVGDFVAMRDALRHPRLEEPVAFVAGHELGPLLRQFRPGMTVRDVVHCWSDRIAIDSAVRLMAWMWHAGVLEVAC